MRATIEPLDSLCHLKKEIFVPHEDFEMWLQSHDWTYHQTARNEFPDGYGSLLDFQLGCIKADPALWVAFFLREPEDPDHQEPYSLWDYQKESIQYPDHTIHKCGSEVGKTREIIAYVLWKVFTTENGSGLVGAPQQTHLDEIIEAIYEQLEYNPILLQSLVKWKKHPHHQFIFDNRFKVYFRPSGYDGEAYRGVHVRTFAIKDEAAKDKNKKQWSEFWRAMKPGCVAKIYSVPDGDRSCDFYKLAQRAYTTIAKHETRNSKPETSNLKLETINPLEPEAKIDSFQGVAKHIQNIKFRLFHWPKTIMPAPYWSAERRKFYIDQYGGEDSPEYKHNVHGDDGDPESTVFPWEQFKYCIKEIPEYRCLKVLVDSANNEVIVTGYKFGYANGDSGPVPVTSYLIDTVYPKTGFFDYEMVRNDEDNGKLIMDNYQLSIPNYQFKMTESEFTRLIRSFFLAVPGLKRGGADFGYSGDPTEIIVKNIVGQTERIVARLQLKHVTYDQQCQALNALDDVYGPQESVSWGTDFGNAGSAVAHDLQGLPQYDGKNYDDRLKGFMFESSTDNVDEDGDPIMDAKTGEPAKITLKEISTDHITKRMQRQVTEYPPDPDYILYYPNHTCSNKGKHRIYKKVDDHLIDAERAEKLAKILGNVGEDIFM